MSDTELIISTEISWICTEMHKELIGVVIYSINTLVIGGEKLIFFLFCALH